VGVSEGRLRKWLLSISAFLRTQASRRLPPVFCLAAAHCLPLACLACLLPLLLTRPAGSPLLDPATLFCVPQPPHAPTSHARLCSTSHAAPPLPLLPPQNGSVAEAIILWKRNVDKEFEGGCAAV
jgi:hypothetical protein